jgi:hypothetical protein
VINAHPSPKSSPTEHEIERLVEEIHQVIEREDPDQRRELHQFASALIADMATDSSSTRSVETTVESERRPFGLVAAGLALLVIGGGFFLIIPPIGAVLVFLGIVLVIWGSIAGWWTMRRPKK